MVARSPFILTALLVLRAFAQDEEDPVPDCNAPPVPVEKVINFSPFFITGGPFAPRPVTNPFSLTKTRNNALGYVFAPRDVTVGARPNPLKSFSEPFLLPNENNWEVVNCTYSNIIPGACVDDALALHLPKGGPGTIGAKTPVVPAGARSPWAVYDLLGFHVMPDVDTTGVNVVVDVQAWGTDGKRLGGLRNVVKGGSSTGYNITLRDGGFKAVMHWMLEVKLDNGERLGYYLDNLAIVEQVYQAECFVERTIGFGPTPTSNTTLKFDDLALGVPVQKKYWGIEFSGGWKTVPAAAAAANSSSEGSGNGKDVAISGNGGSGGLPSIYGANYALFDLVRYRIRPDLSTLPADAVLEPEHFKASVQGFQVCGTGGLGAASAQPRRYVWLENFEWQTIDIAGTIENDQSFGGFKKMQQVQYGMRYYPDPKQYPWIEVGFVVDEIEVRVWPIGNGKGFRQGCYRCLKYLASACEWPLINRGVDNIWS